MALEIDASSPAAFGAVAPGSMVASSSSFTPPAQSLLVVLIAGSTDSSDTTFTSLVGGGLAWERTLSKSPSSTSTGGASIAAGIAEIWTAYTTASPGAMTVTVTASSGIVFAYSAAVVVLTGSEGGRLTGQRSAMVSPTDQGFSGNPLPFYMGGLTDGSYVFVAAIDVDEIGAATFLAGQTAVFNNAYSHIWRTTTTTATPTLTLGMTEPNLQVGNLVAIEIKAARGGGGAGAWLQ